jgi:holo-[acyl-carrier protein] synthase
VIVGIGIDVIEVVRLADALERQGDRVLALAARFAAKEACLKALGTGWAEGLGFRDVEIIREGNQPPRLVLHGEAVRRAEALGVIRSHVSLSHQPGLAAAVVILES